MPKDIRYRKSAVDCWNRIGYLYGPKSKEVRGCLRIVFGICYDAIFHQTRRVFQLISEMIWAKNPTQYDGKWRITKLKDDF